MIITLSSNELDVQSRALNFQLQHSWKYLRSEQILNNGANLSRYLEYFIVHTFRYHISVFRVLSYFTTVVTYFELILLMGKILSMDYGTLHII